MRKFIGCLAVIDGLTHLFNAVRVPEDRWTSVRNAAVCGVVSYFLLRN